MICPSCEYPNFKIVPKCVNCSFDFKKFKGKAPSTLAKAGFTVFAGTPAIALAEAEPEEVAVAEELSPASDLATEEITESKDFNLDLSDVYETPSGEDTAAVQEDMPIPDMIDESELSPDFGSDTDLDVSDIEVEGLGFEGLDLGGTEDTAVEPDLEVPDAEEVTLDLGGTEDIVVEPDLELPDADEVTLDLGGTEDIAVEPDLEVPDTEEVTLDLDGEETDLPPVSEELALSPELDTDISLDLGEDAPAEDAAEPIEFELESDDTPIVTTETDTSVPEIEDLGLEIEISDDPEPPAQ